MNKFLVFDIGGSSVKHAVMTKNGEVIEKGSYKSERYDFDLFIKNMLEISRKAKEEHDILGVAISAPGSVDSKEGVVGGSSALPCIHGPNFKEIFKKELNLTLEIENDANCAALGEVWLGGAKDNRDLAFVVCGTGIGGAIIKDRKIHKGTHLHGGEFGYMILESKRTKDGVEFKTWSDIGSTGGLQRTVAERKGISADELDGKKIFELAESGDEVCKEEIENFYFNIAKGIFNLQYIYDPEKILIGGAISSREDFIDKINENMDLLMNTMTHAQVRPVIDKCKFGNDANLLGALFHYLQSQA